MSWDLPFLVRTDNNIHMVQITGTSVSDHDRTSRTKDLTPRGFQQLTTPLPHLAYKMALWTAFRKFWSFFKARATHGSAVNSSLLQTLMFSYCLASLCIGRMDLGSVTISPHITGKGIFPYKILFLSSVKSFVQSLG